jgi:hypothetical protein
MNKAAPTPTHFTAGQQLALSLHRQGESNTAIAATLGTSRQAAGQLLARAKIAERLLHQSIIAFLQDPAPSRPGVAGAGAGLYTRPR